MKKYILTGGPGTGKSSIVQYLEQEGERGIREAAEDVIRRMQAEGTKEPWMLPDFQERILELQIQREDRVPEGIPRVFIDRGIPDGLAYTEPGTETYKRVIEEARKRRYDKIFLVEQLAETEKTVVRREDHEEAKRVGEKIEGIYRELGYEIIRIPAGPLEERVAKVLEAIE